MRLLNQDNPIRFIREVSPEQVPSGRVFKRKLGKYSQLIKKLKKQKSGEVCLAGFKKPINNVTFYPLFKRHKIKAHVKVANSRKTAYYFETV